MIDTRESLRPNLSAIICTYHRAPLLAGLLGALCRQTLSAQNFEVIVVDDGSIDDTRAVAAAYASWFLLRYSYQDNGGPASARNCGLLQYRGDILLFLDDDNMPAKTLLEEHLKTHRQFPARHDAVLGYMPLSPEVGENPLMHYVTEIGQFLLAYPLLKHGDILDYTYFWGGPVPASARCCWNSESLIPSSDSAARISSWVPAFQAWLSGRFQQECPILGQHENKFRGILPPVRAARRVQLSLYL